MYKMSEHFISEAITPVIATSDSLRMASGEPGLPSEFVWRGRTIQVTAVLRTWRDLGKCDHGSTDMYVRKHWYEISTASDGVMKIYFDRQPRHGRNEGRWWLFSILEPVEQGSDPKKRIIE